MYRLNFHFFVFFNYKLALIIHGKSKRTIRIDTLLNTTIIVKPSLICVTKLTYNELYLTNYFYFTSLFVTYHAQTRLFLRCIWIKDLVEKKNKNKKLE